MQPDEHSPAPRSGSTPDASRRTFSKRRAAVLFGGAGLAVALALTSRWWLPGVPVLLGIVDANSETISVLADIAQLVTFVMLAVGAFLGFLGVRSFRNSGAGGEPRQAVDVAPGGRGVAVDGDVNQGAVFAGDNNRVSIEFAGDVTYDYSDVTPRSTDPGELDEARRRLGELPLEELPDRAALPERSVMPLRPNPHFVGRREDLKRIAASLMSGDTAAIGEVTVAASGGLGGVGKTQLACEFVHRYGRYFHGVYWLSFGNPDGVPTEVASCGSAGGMALRPDFHALPLDERVREVMAAWQGELPRLLVFDDCWDEDLLDRWLPSTGGCRVLITSRRSQWDEALGVTELPLDVLDRRESVALLREYRPDLPAENPGLHAIAKELGDLPLALDLAGRYLKRYRREVTPADYLADVQRPELLDHPSLQQARGVSPTRHDLNVWRTFALSYWKLDPDDEVDGTAMRLLARAARLAPDEPIPDDLLAWALEPPERVSDPPQPTTTLVRDALDRLADLGLLQGSGNGTLKMHRLVAAFALAEVPDDGAQAAVEAACSRAAGIAYREGQPARQEALRPHVRSVADPARGRVDPMAANLCTAMNLSLRQIGAHDEALPYAERAWVISVEIYGSDEKATLQRRSNMGELFEGKGDRVRARAIYEEVLEAQERRWGKDDPDVAATLNNLGASFARDDLYHETLRLYRRALRIRKGVWERTRPDDPDKKENAYEAGEGNSNMGGLMMDLARHREAQPYLERALRIMVGEFGINHERNAGTLVTFGAALRADGNHSQAVSRLMSALDVYKNISTTLPPAAAGALANVGALFPEWAGEAGAPPAPNRAQGLEGASVYLHAALDGCEQMYGEEDHRTGGLLRALAEVCDEQGNTEDGRRYRERAEASRRANFAAEDADAAGALSAQGTSLMSYGLYDEAQAYLERALGIREEAMGEWDFDTSTSLFKLGILFQLRRRDAQARPYLERALAVRMEVCGERHPATELVRENLTLLDT